MPNGDLSTIYSQLCESYRAIDDFRTKLLGFLPLVTGTGIFLLLDEKSAPALSRYRPVIGTFGFIVTLGLFLYEIYGIKKCHALIRTGQVLEDHLMQNEKKEIRGQFIWRPGGALGFIHEGVAASVIYPAVLAAWLFLALAPATTTGPDIEVAISSAGTVVSAAQGTLPPNAKPARTLRTVGRGAVLVFAIFFVLSLVIIYRTTTREVGPLVDRYSTERAKKPAKTKAAAT